jgi:glycosyltransferase involved in cell wall biosynthesis
MKICQVLAGNEDGGLEKHTIELSKQLLSKGLDVTVIAHKDFAKSFENIKFIPLDLSKSRNNFFILFKLYKILKKGNFDIIHTQANKATSMVTKIKSFINAKIVSTLHSYKKNLSAFEKSDFVITVSNKIGLRLRNEKKVTIYNGIEFNEIEKIDDVFQKYNISKNKFLITSVGRLCDVKRFDLLIKSIKDLDVFCILVGDGENKDNLINLAKKENIEEKILFTGSIDNQEVRKILQKVDLSIITSDREGFSYFFAESLVYNTPIISTDVADIKDIIGNNYIVSFNDYNKFNEKINYVKNNYDDVLKDFQEKFEYAQNKFTIENMVNETISVYKEVLK